VPADDPDYNTQPKHDQGHGQVGKVRCEQRGFQLGNVRTAQNQPQAHDTNGYAGDGSYDLNATRFLATTRFRIMRHWVIAVFGSFSHCYFFLNSRRATFFGD
jgi:hypothetical protein